MIIEQRKVQSGVVHTLIALLILLAPAALGWQKSYTTAATFTIADGDVAELKNAMTIANSNGEDDVINLAANGTYTLTVADNSTVGNGNNIDANGLPIVSVDGGHSLTVNGDGATITRFNNNNSYRFFSVDSGAQLTLNALSLTNGGQLTAGALYNRQGTVNLNDCKLLNNSGNDGGAIRNIASSSAAATLNLTDCTLSSNGGNRGGAIYNDGGGTDLSHGGSGGGTATATLTRCTLDHNSTVGAGGAIFNNSNASGNALLNLDTCTIDSNFNRLVNGGGIYNAGGGTGDATVEMTNCTLSNNYTENTGGTTTGSGGGALYVDGEFNNSSGGQTKLDVANCTFSHNSTLKNGGAVYSNTPAYGTVVPLTFSNCTFSDNSAETDGGAIYHLSHSLNLDLVNCTFVNNSAATAGGVGAVAGQIVNSILSHNSGGDLVGSFTSLGDNICSDDGGGSLTGPGDRINTDAKLDPQGLHDNGGPTLTIALLPGSPAIDGGNTRQAPATDQRGVPRPQPAGGQADVGAYEARQFSVSGYLRTASGSPIPNAHISMDAVQGAGRGATPDSSGYYNFDHIAEGQHVLVATSVAYSFTPLSRDVTVSDADVTGQDFTGTPLSLSGRISTSGGAALSGVSVALSRTDGGALPPGVSSPVMTNSAGYYTFKNLLYGSYIVTPTLNRYAMNPQSKTVIMDSGSVSGQNFIGRPTSTIAGHISDGSGAAIANASVTLASSGASPVVTSHATTDSSGSYAFQNVPEGTYTITPSLAGYNFNPTIRSVSVQGVDLSGQDFVASRGHNIAGRVSTSSGVAMPGVTVQLDSSVTTTTNSAGYYTFTNVVSGNHTLTPIKSGTIFTPANKTVAVTNVDVTGQNFIGASGYTVTGRIATSSGAALAGVAVQLDSGPTVTTNSAGYFTINNVTNGSHTITPSKNGLTFTPVNKTVNVNGANVAGQNFVGQ
jgi:predicted outer membrane repeat protein